jgi:hypothetical protein
MRCPKCDKDAKNSTTYPGTFVCDCLGFLEDISLISRDMVGRFRIQKLSSIKDVIAAGKELKNDAGTESSAEDYLRDGCLYKVSKAGKPLYLIWILTENRRIPSGNYFGKMANEHPTEEDRDNFKEITKHLIAQRILNKAIFDDDEDEFAQYYLG